MRLKPSSIYFSQDTIKNCFNSHGTIGSVLDNIYEGTILINTIPMISICQKDGKWFTTDNRRLWIFRELEQLGKCSEIDVRVTHIIPDNKFTTNNGGVSVTVRGNPGSKYATDVSWRESREARRGRRMRYDDSDEDFMDSNSDDTEDSDDDMFDDLMY
ncbi:hypothetical protein ACJMK2_009418 [Sinanodonta woodiana]|uniref:Uncharacterized protein n=1 Tax=Sinanodonta woodiana TaxID=1069815 RepID=A0ABD3VC69_SINWO